MRVSFNPESRRLYWRVDAGNSAGSGPASATGQFFYDRTGPALASCTVLTPSSGAQIPQGGNLLALGLVAGTLDGPVDVEWLLDGLPFHAATVTMNATGFQTDPVDVPTVALGVHNIQLRVTGPIAILSAPVPFEVASRTFGPAVRLALWCEPFRLEPGQSASLTCRVLDAQGRLVENDNGRAIALDLAGMGSLDPGSLTTSGGTVTGSYVAGPGSGTATITATAPGLVTKAVSVVVAASELERLKAEAGQYLDRLGNLTWDRFAPSIPLVSSLDVSGARALVDNSAPGDEQRIRRLNMFLRVVDRSWFHDPELHPYGPREAGTILGAQVLIDDGSRGMSQVYLTSIALIADLRTSASRVPGLAEKVATLEQTTMKLLAHAVETALEKMKETRSSRTIGEIVSGLQSWYQGNGSVSTLAVLSLPFRAALGSVAASRSFVTPTQGHLDYVVGILSHPEWSGGDDGPAEAKVAEAIALLRSESEHYHQEFQGPYDRSGVIDLLASYQSMAAAFEVDPTFTLLSRISAGLNRSVATAIVWAAGMDCLDIATQITGKGLQGFAADAVVHSYAAATGEPTDVITLEGARAGATGLNDACALRGVPGFTQLLLITDSAEESYAAALGALEHALSTRNPDAVRAGLAVVAARGDELFERWEQVRATWLSTSGAARISYPEFLATSDSLGAEGIAAMVAGIEANNDTELWLESSTDEALALLAKENVRACADLSCAFEEHFSAFLIDLLDTPSAALLHLDTPVAPPRLVAGEEALVTAVLRNVGASTARVVRVVLEADASSMLLLGPSAVTVDSLVGGDSLMCAWHVRMLAPAAGPDSVAVVVASLAPTASDAHGSPRPVLIMGALLATTGVTEPVSPRRTRIRGVSPNPAAADVLFSIEVARGQPAGTLEVYSVTGQRIARLDLSGMPPGVHAVRWSPILGDGRSAPPGIYFARLSSDPSAAAQRLVRLR